MALADPPGGDDDRLLLGLVALSERIGPGERGWTIANPVGVVPEEFWEAGFMIPWTAGLLALIVGGVTSTALRFRRSRGEERQQMKWMIWAFGLFGAIYSAAALSQGWESGDLLDVLFALSIIGIPVAITVAVLRYRLYDIDLFIRRTLLYAVLTGLLVAAYLISVFFFRSLLSDWADSSVRVAASTLLAAALFAPLRRRLQDLIDHRLFRTRYNLEQVVARFAARSQNEARLDILSGELLAAVAETMQPRFSRLWIKGTAYRR